MRTFIEVFLGVLQAAFVVLKVIGLITLPWLTVFLPAIVYIGYRLIGILGLVILLAIVSKK